MNESNDKFILATIHKTKEILFSRLIHCAYHLHESQSSFLIWKLFSFHHKLPEYPAPLILPPAYLHRNKFWSSYSYLLLLYHQKLLDQSKRTGKKLLLHRKHWDISI